jgi:hypothetical protein
MNRDYERVKESTTFLSGRISRFKNTCDTFKLSPHNPIVLELDGLIAQYKTLTEHIGKVGQALQKTESEILIDNEN